MTAPRLQRRAFATLLFMLAVLAIPLIPLGFQYLRVRGQHVAIARVHAMGGTVELGRTVLPGTFFPPLVGQVNLSGQHIDRETIEMLGELPYIQSLLLDRATFAPDAWPALQELGGLVHVYISNVDLSDEHVSHVAAVPSLVTLSLRGTSITDEGLANLTTVGPLQTLSIRDTDVTAAGMRHLTALPSLRTLIIDARCLTKDSVRQIQAIPNLQFIRVHLTDGVGKETWEAASQLTGKTIHATNADGTTHLWSADLPWQATAAGVFELVAEEVELDPVRAGRLLKFMASHSREWNRTETSSQWAQSTPRDAAPAIPTPAEITLDEFLDALRAPDTLPRKVKLFARDHVKSDDLPAILAVLPSPGDYSEDRDDLLSCAAFMLARHGAGDDRALAHLDQMLSHTDPFVRSNTLRAFKSQYPSRSDVTPPPSARVADAAIARAVTALSDDHRWMRTAAAEVCLDVVPHHPQYGEHVVPLLIQATEDSRVRPTAILALERIAKVSPVAISPHFSAFTEMYQSADDKQHRRALVLLGTLSEVDARLPQWAYDQCVELLANDTERTNRLLPTLVSWASRDPELIEPLVVALIDKLGDRPDQSSSAAWALQTVARQIRDRKVPLPRQ